MNIEDERQPRTEVSRKECGTCAKWMIKRLCEPEKYGSYRTHNMPACEDYKIAPGFTAVAK